MWSPAQGKRCGPLYSTASPCTAHSQGRFFKTGPCFLASVCPAFQCGSQWAFGRVSSLGTTDILDWIILLWGILYTVGASLPHHHHSMLGAPSPVVITKNVSQRCPVSPEAKSPWSEPPAHGMSLYNTVLLTALSGCQLQIH